MADAMNIIKEFEKEYGIGNVPDGVYHVGLGENTKTYTSKNGGFDYFRMGWKVKCGENTGRELGDMLRWFPDDPTHTKPARGSVVQFAKALAAKVGEDAITEPLTALRSAKTAAEANTALAALAATAKGVGDFYVRMVTKGDFQNVRYLERGEPITTVCPCAAEAVTI